MVVADADENWIGILIIRISMLKVLSLMILVLEDLLPLLQLLGVCVGKRRVLIQHVCVVRSCHL